MRRVLVGFAVGAALFAGCGDPLQDGTSPGLSSPRRASSAASAARHTSAAGSAAASASAPAPTASVFFPPSVALPREERERHIARLLAGDVDAQALPLADTEPDEEFEPGLRRTLASRAEVTIGEPTADGAGPPDLTLTHEALLGRKARLRRCYLLGLAENPNLLGRVGMIAVIAGAGKPKSVENSSTDLPDSKVVECVIAEVRRIDFPAPTSGQAQLTIRVMFSPGP